LAEVRDSSGDLIRIYADYTTKLMPIFTNEYEIGLAELNDLIEHGFADITNYVKGFAVSVEMNCWSKDAESWRWMTKR
jgi:hypothetical protein